MENPPFFLPAGIRPLFRAVFGIRPLRFNLRGGAIRPLFFHTLFIQCLKLRFDFSLKIWYNELEKRAGKPGERFTYEKHLHRLFV